MRENWRLKVTKFCIVCGEPALARELCPSHYKLWWNMMNVAPKPARPEVKCSVCGCKHRAHGLCTKHYKRSWKEKNRDRIRARDREWQREARKKRGSWKVSKEAESIKSRRTVEKANDRYVRICYRLPDNAPKEVIEFCRQKLLLTRKLRSKNEPRKTSRDAGRANGQTSGR